MAKKLRLGVIGTGFAWDRLHYPALKELSDKYEITAVCNKTIDKARGFAERIRLPSENIYGDYRELLKRTDLDVVDLAVPISENYEIAREVLLAGKNLIAEKPFAASPKSARELIRIKDEKKLSVMVAENFRYDEGNRIIKDIISRGQIGEVYQFIYNQGADFEKEMTGNTFAAKEWRQHPDFNGGIFLDGGIHHIALMRFLFGDVKEVHALARKQDESYCPYLCISTMLKFENNVIGNYSYISQQSEFTKPPIGLRIFGTLGNIYLESKECGSIQIDYKDGRSEKKTYAPGRGYYNEFLNYYEGNITSTPEKELGDIQLIFDILQAIEYDTDHIS